MNLTAMRTFVFGLVFTLVGCEFQHAVPDAGTPEPRQAPDTAILNGFTQDMEYHFVSFMACGDPEACPPPLMIGGFPNVEGGKVVNAQLAALPPGGTESAAQEGLTGFDGMLFIADVPVADPGYVYVHGEVDSAAPLPEGEPSPRNYHPDLDWLPTVFGYVPTTTAMPIYTRHQSCLNVRAAFISDIGILQAVARYNASTGSPLATVADLLDPTQTGGVVVNWNLFPDEIYVWVPGFATLTEFSVGTQYAVTWSPPGTMGPEQSDLGFVVDPTNDPEMSVGLAVTVLPVTTAASTEVTIVPVDPLESPEDGRPWPYPSHTLQARPGEVTYLDAMPFPPTVFGEELGPEFCATP